MKTLFHKTGMFFAIVACVLTLSACRTTVPTPSMQLSDRAAPVPKYSMFNVGPQRVSESRAVKLVDLDQDGNLDLLIGSRGLVDGFHIEWGDGEGHWRMQDGPLTSMHPRAFAVADVDKDGRLEILIGGDGDQKGLQIWKLLDDDSTWELHSVPVEAGVYHDVKFADVNTDGWSDIVAARSDNVTDGGLYVLLNDGQGQWLAGVGPMVAGVFTDLAVVDMNQDGHVDIVASRRGGLGAVKEDDRNPVSAWRGGGHVQTHARRGVGNQDDWYQTGGVQLWYGDGNARWRQEVLPAEADAESVTVADVDGDGDLDIVAGLYRLGVRLWLANDAEWTLKDVTDSGTWSDIRVGDLENDGDRELIASSSDGQGLGVWSWSSLSGGFVGKPGLIPNYGMYSSLDIGSVRHSDVLDVAAVRMDGGVEVWSGLQASLAKKQPLKGQKVGEGLTIYFDSLSATLNEKAVNHINAWRTSLLESLAKKSAHGSPEHGSNKELSGLRYELVGRADVRAIHSDLFPNNMALSRARGESVAAWLNQHGAQRSKINMRALGASEPLHKGLDEVALSQNRSVFVQAYRMDSVRIPGRAGEAVESDLFHISENAVFKEIDGIPGYKVGAGDLLSITFWQGGKADEHKVTVQVDGTVSLPYQAELKVSGMTPREIDRHVTEVLKRFERQPRIDVQVLKARSKTISIFGEIQNLTRQPTGPGTYFLKGKESMVEFLSRAGGPSKEADLTKVQIIRDGKTILLDIDRAIKQGDWSENAIVDDGDTIFIPSLAQSKRRIYVLGSVSKPGIVEFVGDINFLDAVAKSGGFGKDAYLPEIRVIRADRDAPLIMAIDFERFMQQGDLSQNLALQDKDVVIIPDRPIANWNQFVADISPTLSLILQPISVATDILTLKALLKQQ